MSDDPMNSSGRGGGYGGLFRTIMSGRGRSGGGSSYGSDGEHVRYRSSGEDDFNDEHDSYGDNYSVGGGEQQQEEEGVFLYITSLTDMAVLDQQNRDSGRDDDRGEQGEGWGANPLAGVAAGSVDRPFRQFNVHELNYRPPQLEVIQRLVSGHPATMLGGVGSIETILETWKDPRDSTTWLRVSVKNGPETSFITTTCFQTVYQLPRGAIPLSGNEGQILCWTSFPEHPHHKVLCVLVHRTAVRMYDVFPDPKSISSFTNFSSEGKTVNLPFDCCAIQPLGQSRGFILQKLEHHQYNSNTSPTESTVDEEEDDDHSVAVNDPLGADGNTISGMQVRGEGNVDEVSVLTTVTGKMRPGGDRVGSDASLSKYKNYPLVRSMIRNERTRSTLFLEQGKLQMLCPKSSDGWVKSLFIVQARALDQAILPWILVMLHATCYTIAQEVFYQELIRKVESWEVFFGLVINWTLSYLLVFRMNRSALRYWEARRYWGHLVEKGRTIVGGLLVHGEQNPYERSEAIRWVAALSVTTMEFMRGNTKEMPHKAFAGVLTKDEIKLVERNPHPPLFVADEARRHMKKLFRIDATTPSGIAHAWTRYLDTLEKQLNGAIDCCGSMERIRSTPLPIAFVAHLRTFLLGALFMQPWIWGPGWGWPTIPFVALTSFALLGLEAASTEVESPFLRNRINHLNQDGFCESLLSNIQQQIRNHADKEMHKLQLAKEAELEEEKGEDGTL